MPHPSARTARFLLLGLALVAVGCHDGGPPMTETPSDLTLSGTLPAGPSAAVVTAEAEAREGPVFAVLASADPVAAAFELTLPGTVPATVRSLDPDVASLVCPGATSHTLAVSRSPLSWLELRELWAATGDLQWPLRAASRAGISLDAPGGFEPGDVLHHWVHTARSITVQGGCDYDLGSLTIVRQVDLALRAGWTALATEVADAVGGFPTSIVTSTAADPTDVSWWAGEPLLGGVATVRVPSSRFHHNATWWGYQQTKLVRHGDDLWIAVTDNDVPAGQPLRARVLRREAGEADGWLEVASLASSRPAQLLLHDGVVHALVHVEDPVFTYDTVGPVDAHEVGSGRSLRLATRANIRYGATVDASGRGWIAWGGVPLEPAIGTDQAFQVFAGEVDAYDVPDDRWQLAASSQLDAAYHYPYLVADDDRLLIAAVENQNVGDPSSNRYQRVFLWQIGLGGSTGDDEAWLDYSSDPLAATRLRLVEVSDLYLATDGRAHLLVKEFLDPANPGAAALRHVVQDAANAGWVDAPPPQVDCSWARFVELAAGASPPVVCSSDGALAVTTLDGAQSIGLRVPPSLRGAYAYLAAPRSGTAVDVTIVDILLVSGSSQAYPYGSALVLSVPRSAVAAALSQ